MTKQNQDTNTPTNELPDEYFKFVKTSVENGSYFKDSLNWYLLRYVNPICDRTLMAFAGIISCISLYFLIQIISSTFPLVEKVPIVISDHDASLYRPVIKELKKIDVNKTFTADELVAKYLLSTYVVNRESYDYRASDVSEVNTKFNRIKNNSSYGEYKNFQLFMSRENAESPLNNFGRNIYQTTEIVAINFKKEQKNYSQFRAFFKNNIPQEAEITFTNTTHTVNEDGTQTQKRQNYLARIKFKFDGLDRDAKSGVLNFVVNEYNLFKIR